MIYPLIDTKGRCLTHALIVKPAPRFEERKEFIFKFSRNPHVWFIRSHIRKANGTAQLYFRVEKSPEGTEMLRKDTPRRTRRVRPHPRRAVAHRPGRSSRIRTLITPHRYVFRI